MNFLKISFFILFCKFIFVINGAVVKGSEYHEPISKDDTIFSNTVEYNLQYIKSFLEDKISRTRNIITDIENTEVLKYTGSRIQKELEFYARAVPKLCAKVGEDLYDLGQPIVGADNIWGEEPIGLEFCNLALFKARPLMSTSMPKMMLINFNQQVDTDYHIDPLSSAETERTSKFEGIEKDAATKLDEYHKIYETYIAEANAKIVEVKENITLVEKEIENTKAGIDTLKKAREKERKIYNAKKASLDNILTTNACPLSGEKWVDCEIFKENLEHNIERMEKTKQLCTGDLDPQAKKTQRDELTSELSTLSSDLESKRDSLSEHEKKISTLKADLNKIHQQRQEEKKEFDEQKEKLNSLVDQTRGQLDEFKNNFKDYRAMMAVEMCLFFKVTINDGGPKMDYFRSAINDDKITWSEFYKTRKDTLDNEISRLDELCKRSDSIKANAIASKDSADMADGTINDDTKIKLANLELESKVRNIQLTTATNINDILGKLVNKLEIVKANSIKKTTHNLRRRPLKTTAPQPNEFELKPIEKTTAPQPNQFKLKPIIVLVLSKRTYNKEAVDYKHKLCSDDMVAAITNEEKFQRLLAVENAKVENITKKITTMRAEISENEDRLKEMENENHRIEKENAYYKFMYDTDMINRGLENREELRQKMKKVVDENKAKEQLLSELNVEKKEMMTQDVEPLKEKLENATNTVADLHANCDRILKNFDSWITHHDSQERELNDVYSILSFFDEIYSDIIDTFEDVISEDDAEEMLQKWNRIQNVPYEMFKEGDSFDKYENRRRKLDSNFINEKLINHVDENGDAINHFKSDDVLQALVYLNIKYDQYVKESAAMVERLKEQYSSSRKDFDDYTSKYQKQNDDLTSRIDDASEAKATAAEAKARVEEMKADIVRDNEDLIGIWDRFDEEYQDMLVTVANVCPTSLDYAQSSDFKIENSVSVTVSSGVVDCSALDTVTCVFKSLLDRTQAIWRFYWSEFEPIRERLSDVQYHQENICSYFADEGRITSICQDGDRSINLRTFVGTNKPGTGILTKHYELWESMLEKLYFGKVTTMPSDPNMSGRLALLAILGKFDDINVVPINQFMSQMSTLTHEASNIASAVKCGEQSSLQQDADSLSQESHPFMSLEQEMIDIADDVSLYIQGCMTRLEQQETQATNDLSTAVNDVVNKISAEEVEIKTLNELLASDKEDRATKTKQLDKLIEEVLEISTQRKAANCPDSDEMGRDDELAKIVKFRNSDEMGLNVILEKLRELSKFSNYGFDGSLVEGLVISGQSTIISEIASLEEEETAHYGSYQKFIKQKNEELEEEEDVLDNNTEQKSTWEEKVASTVASYKPSMKEIRAEGAEELYDNFMEWRTDACEIDKLYCPMNKPNYPEYLSQIFNNQYYKNKLMSKLIRLETEMLWNAEECQKLMLPIKNALDSLEINYRNDESKAPYRTLLVEAEWHKKCEDLGVKWGDPTYHERWGDTKEVIARSVARIGEQRNNGEKEALATGDWTNFDNIFGHGGDGVSPVTVTLPSSPYFLPSGKITIDAEASGSFLSVMKGLVALIDHELDPHAHDMI